MESVSRRKFVVLAGVPAVFSPQSGRAQSPNSKVVLGRAGIDVCRELRKGGNAEFKSVCEVNDQRGAEIIKKLEEIRGVRPQRVVDTVASRAHYRI
jgi:hypothetical protein